MATSLSEALINFIFVSFVVCLPPVRLFPYLTVQLILCATNGHVSFSGEERPEVANHSTQL